MLLLSFEFSLLVIVFDLSDFLTLLTLSVPLKVLLWGKSTSISVSLLGPFFGSDELFYAYRLNDDGLLVELNGSLTLSIVWFASVNLSSLEVSTMTSFSTSSILEGLLSLDSSGLYDVSLFESEFCFLEEKMFGLADEGYWMLRLPI
jgi:hypothetical protein